MAERKTEVFTPAVGSAPFRRVTRKLAGVLLDTATDGKDRSTPLTVRGIAVSMDVAPETVCKSLEFLEGEGALRLERQRLVIDEDMLRKLATGKN